MIFSWLKRRRRAKLQSQPFPDEWTQFLDQNVAFYRRLSDDDKAKLRGHVQIFVAEKNWEGCGGLTMTDEMKVTIAAQACLLVLSLPGEHFDAVRSILVYPNAYVAPGRTVTPGGLVIEGDSYRDGEAWVRGPVILSWAETLASARHESDGRNLVFHEFAHQLDMQHDHIADGTPALASAELYERWERVMNDEHKRLTIDCRQGRPTLLDCYAATNRAEFFAGASECFFERPYALRGRHPALYAILQEYYQQDPTTWG
ncbi:MAG: M90 family metallopeptidase [Planctomycetaceae bacterium]